MRRSVRAKRFLRKLRGKCTREQSRRERAVIADRTRSDRPAPRLSSPQRLREPFGSDRRPRVKLSLMVAAPGVLAPSPTGTREDSYSERLLITPHIKGSQ